MNRKDEIKSAYRSLGKAHSIYDGQMLGTTRIGRWMLKHVWRMTREDALEYQAMAFEAIPKHFAERANAHTDKMIRRFYIKSGFFTPPFETVDSLRKRLSGMYSEAVVRNVESIAVFQCRK